MRSRSSRFVHREKRPIAPIHLPPEAPPRVPRPTRQSSSPAAPPRRDRSRPAMPYSGVAYAYGPPSPPAAAPPAARLSQVTSAGRISRRCRAPGTPSAWETPPLAHLPRREELVSCAGDSLTICSERIEDLVGGLGPHKRPWVLVPGLDPRPDVSLQGLNALVDAALQRLGGQLAEPPLDQVEPRRAGRDEVQLEAGMGGQPPLDGVGFVGGVVVADQMDIQLGGHLLVELDQELAELHRAVPAVDRADHLAA